MKRLFAILLTTLPVLGFANEVYVDGLYYNIIEGTTQAEVISCGREGDIVIPSTITENGIEYKVTSIGDNVFNSSYITSIEIPASVTSIGSSAFE